MTRVILFIPKFVYDEIKVGFCKHNSDKLFIHVHDLITCDLIPYMTIIEEPNFYSGKVDRCCKCDCDNRYKYFRVRKEEIEDFITTQKNDYILFFDNLDIGQGDEQEQEQEEIMTEEELQ